MTVVISCFLMYRSILLHHPVLFCSKAMQFAQSHNLRVAIKSSGHDYLGRSTAKNSLLIHIHKLQSVNFTDNFVVNGKSKGSAVTVGSGVSLSQLYTAIVIRARFTLVALLLPSLSQEGTSRPPGAGRHSRLSLGFLRIVQLLWQVPATHTCFKVSS
jgi:FAD binding domain